MPAVLVGYALGILIAISIGYASLILGFSIEGSELAAILGFGVLRGVLRRSSIVENNINQTIASAVNGASSGIMFSVPAIFILGYQDQLDPAFLILGCIAGGILGIAFIIPLRKQMIDFNRLAYPGGIAVAAILKSPGEGLRKARWLLLGGLLSAALHLVVQIADLHGHDWGHVDVGGALGWPTYLNAVWDVSLLTVGVGFLAGRGGLYFVVGGYACYWILAPLLALVGELPAAPHDPALPGLLRGDLFRPVGIGMLIGGALTGIVLALPLVVSAIRSMQRATRSGAALSRDELPIRFLYVAVLAAVVLLFVMATRSAAEMGWGRGLLIAILGTLWIWVAGVVLSECIGRTNWSPLSGMTLIGVTLLIFLTSGLGDKASIVASIMVGAAMCVAMSQATDLMMDLKTGYLVGASPRKQQIGQLLAAWLGPIVVVGLVFVLHDDYGLGSEKLPAPQAAALAGVAEGLLAGDVPVAQYGAGAALGAALSASGVGGLGILVGLGFYLPFGVVLTYTIGTVLRLSADRWLGRSFAEKTGVPIAAGLLVGEALIGVGFALYRVIAGAATGGGA